jgi:hypothetical protein
MQSMCCSMRWVAVSAKKDSRLRERASFRSRGSATLQGYGSPLGNEFVPDPFVGS